MLLTKKSIFLFSPSTFWCWEQTLKTKLSGLWLAVWISDETYLVLRLGLLSYQGESTPSVSSTKKSSKLCIIFLCGGRVWNASALFGSSFWPCLFLLLWISPRSWVKGFLSRSWHIKVLSNTLVILKFDSDRLANTQRAFERAWFTGMWVNIIRDKPNTGVVLAFVMQHSEATRP